MEEILVYWSDSLGHKLIKFLRMLLQEKFCWFGLKGTEKRRLLIPKVLQEGNRLIKLLSSKHMLSFIKKER